MYKAKTRKSKLGETNKIYSDSLPLILNRIPPIIWKEIFMHLTDINDFCSLRGVCTLFNKMASSDVFWKRKYENLFKEEENNESKDLFIF